MKFVQASGLYMLISVFRKTVNDFDIYCGLGMDKLMRMLMFQTRPYNFQGFSSQCFGLSWELCLLSMVCIYRV